MHTERMPWIPSSALIVADIARAPCLDAVYAGPDTLKIPTAAFDTIWINVPSRRSRIAGSTASEHKNGPFRLTSSKCAISVGDRSRHARRAVLVPALLTRISTSPSASVTARCAAVTSCPSLTSASANIALPPSASTIPSVSANVSRDRPVSANRHPAAPNASASARPIPVPAPVIQTARPASPLLKPPSPTRYRSSACWSCPPAASAHRRVARRYPD